jgi:hypothetical protein
MHNDTTEPFWFPAVGRKKVTAAFDGGRLTSDGGVMLLAAAERRIGIAHRLAGLIADPRNPLLVTHSVVDILRARMLAIACGYEDADDLDHLRTDPGFKLACGRLPDTGDDPCSQPTMSRWENAPCGPRYRCRPRLDGTGRTMADRRPRKIVAPEESILACQSDVCLAHG